VDPSFSWSLYHHQPPLSRDGDSHIVERHTHSSADPEGGAGGTGAATVYTFATGHVRRHGPYSSASPCHSESSVAFQAPGRRRSSGDPAGAPGARDSDVYALGTHGPRDRTHGAGEPDGVRHLGGALHDGPPGWSGDPGGGEAGIGASHGIHWRWSSGRQDWRWLPGTTSKTSEHRWHSPATGFYALVGDPTGGPPLRGHRVLLQLAIVGKPDLLSRALAMRRILGPSVAALHQRHHGAGRRPHRGVGGDRRCDD